MNREEFLRQFREALAGKVPESVINENAAYYRNYINNQVSSGMSEEDVLRALGDPRLLAKTIEESSKFTREHSAEQRYSSTYTETYSNAHGGAYSDTYSNSNADYSRNAGYGQPAYENSGGSYARHKVTTVPLWLVIIVILIIIGIIIVALLNLFVFFLPFILVGVLVSAGYKIVKSIFS